MNFISGKDFGPSGNRAQERFSRPEQKPPTAPRFGPLIIVLSADPHLLPLLGRHHNRRHRIGKGIDAPMAWRGSPDAGASRRLPTMDLIDLVFYGIRQENDSDALVGKGGSAHIWEKTDAPKSWDDLAEMKGEVDF
jgi:hypothetical protein